MIKLDVLIKFGIAFAAFAFIITILTGIVSGVSFWAVLLRTLISVIVFALLGGGVAFIIDKYLPEILTAFSGEELKNSVEENKEGINIVLPEENPHEDLVGEDFENEQVEEIYGEEEEEPGDTEIEKNEEVESVKKQSETVEAAESNEDALEDSIESTNLDSLPGIDSLGEGFTTNNNNDQAKAHTPKSNIDTINGMDQDPETAAKAIKTWLSRDKEG
jgi:hypothetical protein